MFSRLKGYLDFLDVSAPSGCRLVQVNRGQLRATEGACPQAPTRPGCRFGDLLHSSCFASKSQGIWASHIALKRQRASMVASHDGRVKLASSGNSLRAKLESNLKGTKPALEAECANLFTPRSEAKGCDGFHTPKQSEGV